MITIVTIYVGIMRDSHEGNTLYVLFESVNATTYIGK